MSRIYLAGAGSGKTTFLLDLAVRFEGSVLYTTFTDENIDVAKDMLIGCHGCMPANITLLPWFSLLLEHGVRPFQGSMGFRETSFVGVNLNPEGINYNARPSLGYFCDSSNAVYAAKLPELTLLCNEASGGSVFDRLLSLYDLVLIDEAQDLASYDFDFVAELIKNGMEIILCGDKRQATYRTNHGKKHGNKDFPQFLVDSKLDSLCPIDAETLNGSHRCSSKVIGFANLLYPDMPATESLRDSSDGEQSGVWLVPSSLASNYVESVNPVVLRDRASEKTVSASAIMNFGKSKGRTYDDVLIYPVSGIKNWLLDNSVQLKPRTRSRFYVAITRARNSVGIVVPDSEILRYPTVYKRWASCS